AVLLLAVVPVGGKAGPAGSADAAPADAGVWLMRAHEAASTRNYRGTLVVSSVGAVSSSRVVHFCESGQQFERIEALDGEPRSMWRHGDLVQTLWPRARVAVIEQRDPRTGFPAVFTGAEKRVPESYELKLLGQDRVAGHDADVVLLKARDSARFSQRLWAERGTGLLLRADILAPGGQALESAAFSELAIGIKPQPELVLAGLKRLEGYRVLRPALMSTTLDAEGWSIGNLPPGFREVQCAKRSLDPAGAPGSAVVLQAIYTDGLTHVSLFIEPFQPKRHQSEAYAAIGATHTLMLRRDDQWVTVMGDVPLETLKRFAAALDRKR
ncbi:MucB/RseB C-terminal domain-containing protein, partial [Ideonella sp.]|uniref:MucB/RseB C-terminal domain-containing protein n=1 Tax=Ideonella sp. TaxID=1929293 RepID=UPI003BB5622C